MSKHWNECTEVQSTWQVVERVNILILVVRITTVHTKHAQSNDMHMPLLGVGMADKNA